MAYADIARLLVAEGQPTEAEELLRSGLGALRHPDKPSFAEDFLVREQLAIHLWLSNRRDEALELYFQRVRENPSSAEALWRLGLFLSQVGCHELALDNFRRASLLVGGDDYPWHCTAMRAAASELLVLGRLAEGVEQYRIANAARGCPEDKTALLRHASALLDQTWNQQEDAQYRANARYYESRDVSTANLRELEALDVLDEGTRLPGESFEAARLRGAALERLGRLDEAFESYTRSFELACAVTNTDIASQLVELPRTLIAYCRTLTTRHGRPDEAYLACETAIAKFPAPAGKAMAHLTYARLLTERGVYAKAVEQARAACDLQPNNVDCWIGLGLAVDGDGFASAAVEAWVLATELSRTANIAHRRITEALATSQEGARRGADLAARWCSRLGSLPDAYWSRNDYRSAIVYLSSWTVFHVVLNERDLALQKLGIWENIAATGYVPQEELLASLETVRSIAAKTGNQDIVARCSGIQLQLTSTPSPPAARQ